MKTFSRFLIVPLLALGLSAAQAYDLDDSIIREQIQVAVTQYRHVVGEFEKLQNSIRQGSGEETDVMEYPSVKHFVQASLNPSEMQMRDLFERYSREYGDKKLRRLAKSNQFEDLLRD